MPLFALFLLWLRRDMMPRGATRGNLWGLPLFVLWALTRCTAEYFQYGSLPEMSMLFFFAGVAVFVGGWQGLKWAWPSVVFLVFMLPLPGFIENFSREWLQMIATILSVFVIQTVGIPATSEGVVIQLPDKALQVAEACSGLRMMMLFAAICVGAAFIVRRPLWEKLVMVASAAPIAIAANVVRIVLTGVLCELARQWPAMINVETAENFMHDMAGLLMMPVGLAMLLAEMTLISKLLISPESGRALVAGRVLAKEQVVAGTELGVRQRKPD